MPLTESEEKKYIEDIRKGWRSFNEYDLPDYNEEILVELARHGSSFIHKLPAHLKTEQVILALAENDKSNTFMSHISPSDTKAYRDVAIKAISSSPGNVRYVESSYIDKNFMIDTVSASPQALSALLKEYHDIFHDTFDTTAVEKALDRSDSARTMFLSGIISGKTPTTLIFDEYIKKTLLSTPSIAGHLMRANFKTNLLLEIISEGGWPDAHSNCKPNNLDDAFRKLLKPKSTTVQSWQQAYVMTFGLEKALKLCKSSGRMDVLEGIYSRDEIMPHLKNRKGNRVKGEWLEDALGL